MAASQCAEPLRFIFCRDYFSELYVMGEYEGRGRTTVVRWEEFPTYAGLGGSLGVVQVTVLCA